MVIIFYSIIKRHKNDKTTNEGSFPLSLKPYFPTECIAAQERVPEN